MFYPPFSFLLHLAFQPTAEDGFSASGTCALFSLSLKTFFNLLDTCKNFKSLIYYPSFLAKYSPSASPRLLFLHPLSFFSLTFSTQKGRKTLPSFRTKCVFFPPITHIFSCVYQSGLKEILAGLERVSIGGFDYFVSLFDAAPTFGVIEMQNQTHEKADFIGCRRLYKIALRRRQGSASPAASLVSD